MTSRKEGLLQTGKEVVEEQQEKKKEAKPKKFIPRKNVRTSNRSLW